VEFDPTNGLMAGQNLIRVCTARTPEQAVPVAGGFLGRPGDFTGLEVSVEVTVHSANHATPASPGDDHAGLTGEGGAEPMETELVTKPE
jgi:hypothetical protein